MRPMRGCKKPRLEADEEDEAEREPPPRKENEKLKDLVQRLKKVEIVKKEVEIEKVKVELEKVKVEEDRLKVEEDMKRVEKVKNKVEEDKAKVEQEKVQVELAKLAVEEDRLMVEKERVEMKKMSKELQSQVECPVCLTMPREDKAVPCCPLGHIVCSTCKDNSIRQGRRDCPTCRGPMGQGQSLLALTVIKNLQHECRHQGCKELLNFNQIKEHEEECIWRLIPCPGLGIHCTAHIPLCNVLNHAQGCPNCIWPPTQKGGEGLLMKNWIKDDNVGTMERLRWAIKILESEEGWFFFVRSTRKEGVYIVDVLMKGSQEDCENFMVEASILNAETRKPVFKSSFQPRPLTDQNVPIFCLSAPERGLSKAWKYDEDGGGYTIVCSVKIVKLD